MQNAEQEFMKCKDYLEALHEVSSKAKEGQSNSHGRKFGILINKDFQEDSQI